MVGQQQPVWDAEQVLALRQHLGMTQQELAQELNVRQQTVSEWETGQHTPRGASVRMLSIVAEQSAGYSVSPKKRPRRHP